VKNFNKMELIT